MSFNLIDEAKSLLPPDLISRAAGSLGESESGIQRAVNGSIPTVLSGLLNQSSTTGASGILDMVRSASGSNISGNVSGLLSGGSMSGIASTVMGWLRSLFGDRLSSITNSLASFAGIKPSSASSVMSLAAPAVLGSVGNYVRDNNLNASGLDSFLMAQKNSILNAIPSGFNLAGALGLSSLSDIGSRISSTVSSAGNYAANTVRRTSGMRWLWFLLLLLGAGLLIWLFTRKPAPKDEVATVVSDTSATTTTPAVAMPPVTVKGKLDTVTGNYIYDVGDMITIDLPNDVGQLNVGRYSTEARLVEFLKDPNAVVDTVNGNWFDFTDVRFKTGSSTITDDSYTQLKNLMAIIKAFPNATFKVGGYTDNTGDASANLALSQKRADAVAAAIVKQGANKAQITKAEGYGQEHPVGDNSTADGRAMNRRVSVRVKSK
jgi:outer membrane protein OmpA-like peptidoglycan-associated protein